MKRFLLMIFVALLATNMAMSQKVTSKSHSIQTIKTKKPTKPWYISIKGGGGFMSSDLGTGGMYDVEVGFTKYFSSQPKGWFWGVQLGSDMCGVKYSWRNWAGSYLEMKPAIYIGPSIGFGTSLERNISLSLNFSANVMYFLADYYPSHHFGGLAKLQPGVWFNKFYVGLEVLFQANSDLAQGGLAGQIGFRF